jgi:hypothetical protein
MVFIIASQHLEDIHIYRYAISLDNDLFTTQTPSQLISTSVLWQGHIYNTFRYSFRSPWLGNTAQNIFPVGLDKIEYLSKNGKL